MNTSQLLTETLVDHLPKLRRIVDRIAKNEGVVDDIAQETCVCIIEKEERTISRRERRQFFHPEIDSFSKE